MRRHYSLPRTIAIIIVLALMVCYFVVTRSLAHVVGDAPALLILVVLIGLVTPLDLHLEAVVRRRMRERVGKCECGYDVRATVERCPECGRTLPMDAGRASLPASRGSAGASPSQSAIS